MVEHDSVPSAVHSFLDTLMPPPYSGVFSVGNWSESVTFTYFLGNILNTEVVPINDNASVMVYYMWVPSREGRANCLLYVVSEPEYHRVFSNPEYLSDMLQTHAPVLYTGDWFYDSEQRCLVAYLGPDKEPSSVATWEECTKSTVSFK